MDSYAEQCQCCFLPSSLLPIACIRLAEDVLMKRTAFTDFIMAIETRTRFKNQELVDFT